MTTNESSADVIIIGGGVIGCAIAYYLGASHGISSLIIERNGIASEASGGAAGELAAAELTEKGSHRPSPTFTQFLLEGISVHANLAPALLEESGIDYLLADIPMLRPAFSPDEVDDMQSQLAYLKSTGVSADWIDRETLHDLGSWVANEALGAIQSTELQVESYSFAIALARAAEANGAEVRSGDVTGIERDGSRVTGVRLGNDVLHADRVIIANGPWSKFAGEWVGLDVPVIPLRGQIVHVDCPPGVPLPHHAIFHTSGYVLPKASGKLYVGTTIEDVGFDRSTTTDARDAIMEAVGRLAPRVLDLPIREMTACLRPYSLDDNPIIGAVPGLDGLFIATGHAFKGITLCLITGKSLAELIATGASEFPLDDFSPARLRSK